MKIPEDFGKLGVDKRHQKRMRKTKARLVEELESLERELAQVKLGGKSDSDDGGLGHTVSTAAPKERHHRNPDIPEGKDYPAGPGKDGVGSAPEVPK